MNDTYGHGARVAYTGDMPCDRLVHYGRVIADPVRHGGTPVVWVRFGCCEVTREIPVDDLQPAR